MSQTILIVHADTKNIPTLKTTLQESGFVIHVENRIEKVLQKIEGINPDLIIIDLDTTGFQSFDLCRTLRIENEQMTPIILVSERDEEFDLVLGFELGADDFIRKPFRMKEFTARIKSVLRRYNLCCTESPVQQIHQTDDHREIIISKENFTVSAHGQIINLTRKEYELLLYLCENRDKPLSRETLLKVVSEEVDLADPRIIDVFVSKIREKIEPCRSKPKYIKTVRNIGYMISGSGIYIH